MTDDVQAVAKASLRCVRALERLIRVLEETYAARKVGPTSGGIPIAGAMLEGRQALVELDRAVPAKAQVD